MNASRTALDALEHFLDDVGAHGGVLEVEADQGLTANHVPNDPGYDWWQKDTISAINIEEAWDIEKGGSNVVVQVIDSGTQVNHPDLQANIWKNPGEICGNGDDEDGNGYVDDCHGWDHGDNDADPADPNGHGTHCIGTVGAVSDNGQGVAGIAQVQLMTNEFMDSSGSGWTSDAVLAIQYGAENGAHISPVDERAVRARRRGLRVYYALDHEKTDFSPSSSPF